MTGIVRAVALYMLRRIRVSGLSLHFQPLTIHQSLFPNGLHPTRIPDVILIKSRVFGDEWRMIGDLSGLLAYPKRMCIRNRSRGHRGNGLTKHKDSINRIPRGRG
jgi:hypothetical protein